MYRVRFNNYKGKSTTEFTSTHRVVFVITLIVCNSIEKLDYNIRINVKFITRD